VLITASLSDWTSVVGLGFAALAAFFAGRAVHYARQTVKDGERASDAAANRHAEQIVQMKTATEAAAEQHRVELEDRRRVAEAEALERRLRQLSVVTEMVLQVGNFARDIALRHQGANFEPTVVGVAQIPSMLITLDGGVAILAALGLPTPTKTVELIRVGSFAGAPVAAVAGMSVDALFELQQLTLDVGANPARVPTDR